MEKFNSVCGQTMVGIVQTRPSNARGETPDHMSNFTATCFYAHQHQRFDIETTREEHIGGNQKASTIVKHQAMALKGNRPSDVNFLQVETSRESDFYIETINQNAKALGW